MKVLKDNERYLDTIATAVALKYIEMKPPQSPADNIKIATIAYKQALAMLEVKLRLDTVLKDTPFLVGERVENMNNKKD